MTLIAESLKPHVKRWTKKEFNDYVERGFLDKQRVILFRGELIEMPAMGTLHVKGVKNVGYWLHANFRPEFEVHLQMPFEAFDETMPQPDAGLFTKEQEARLPHPNEALLLIEVSDSSIELDQNMAFDYAASRVPEYWIVNVRERHVEIYRDPVPNAASATGFKYASHRVAYLSETLSPLAKPAAAVRVADLVSTS